MVPLEADSDWLDVVEWLGGDEALTASAREHGAFGRPRGVRCAADVARLVFTYGPGGYSLRLSAACGIADISDVAVLNRIRAAANWFEFLFKERVAGMSETIARESGLRPVRIVDSTRIEGPGKSVWRLHLCYDAGLGRIVDGAITTLQEGERLDRLSVTPGEIRLGDRGFAQPGGIKNTLDLGADVLVRLTWNSVQLSGVDEKLLDWNKLFRAAGWKGSLDMPVRLHKAHDTSFAPVPLRLVMIKKPPQAAAKSRAKARRDSRKSHKTTDPRTLRAADFMILLTSLDNFSVDELDQLYQIRWQIELAFKRLKSIHHIDRLPAKDPKLAKAWLYAHLIFALIVDDKSARVRAIPPSPLSTTPDLHLAHDLPHRSRDPQGNQACV